jgi:hypothetical protein
METAMKHFLRLMLAALLVLVLAYSADHLALVYRIPRGRPQFGSVQVQRVYAVKLKNHKTEYMFDPPQPQPCVHSVFPQLGLIPCWYRERHRTDEVDY